MILFFRQSNPISFMMTVCTSHRCSSLIIHHKRSLPDCKCNLRYTFTIQVDYKVQEITKEEFQNHYFQSILVLIRSTLICWITLLPNHDTVCECRKLMKTGAVERFLEGRQRILNLVLALWLSH